MANAHVRDITARDFQKEVVERSMTTPVLLDFWAAWCGPCRTLGPVLDKLAAEFGGAFMVGKVDTEVEQDLAYAFGVQGIPFCVLVDGGRPVDAFTGALPEAEVRKFLQKNGIQPMVAAEDAAAEPEKPIDPNSPQGRWFAGLAAARKGDADGSRQALEGIPEEDEHRERAERVLQALPWFEFEPTGAGQAEEALVRGRQSLLAGDAQAAMEHLLASVAADKGFAQGMARKAMLLCFALIGEEDERLDAVRRRLATMLY